MATFTRFEDMDVWRTARALTKSIYAFSATGQFARDFGLRDQMRRAAVSIMSNIAEGCDSRTNPMFVEYLGRARASGGELRCQLYIALDLAYITQEQFETLSAQCEKCCRQMSRLIAYLETQGAYRLREEPSLQYDAVAGSAEDLD